METYLWSDAWILQAIAKATISGPADLVAVIAAADALQHALPTDDELRGALRRLVDGGFIHDDAGHFRLASKVPEQVVKAMRDAGLQGGYQAAANLLESEKWSKERNVRDPRNQVEYPGLTDEVLRRANREYDRQIRKAMQVKRAGPAS